MKQRIIMGLIFISLVLFFICMGVYFYIHYNIDKNKIDITISEFKNNNFLYYCFL